MKLKRVSIIVSLALLAASLTAEAQLQKVYRIGYLWSGTAESKRVLLTVFRESMRAHGWIEGQHFLMEPRFADGKLERLPDLAGELVRLKVDLIVTAGIPAVRALRNATTTIPIVFTAHADPVGTGVVTSLSRPGGNITGLSMMSPELVGKRLELLKEAVPKVSRVAILWDPAGAAAVLREAQAAAQALGFQFQLVELRGPDEFEAAFTAATKGGGAVYAIEGPGTWDYLKRIAELAAKTRLPAMGPWTEFVEAGGLMAYSISIPDLYRRTAGYVDKILKGAKPADLPVEQPAKFELVINLKTAKALGLTIPQSVLFRADKVIQ